MMHGTQARKLAGMIGLVTVAGGYNEEGVEEEDGDDGDDDRLLSRNGRREKETDCDLDNTTALIYV